MEGLSSIGDFDTFLKMYKCYQECSLMRRRSNASVGYSFKSIKSEVTGLESTKAEANAYDFGIIIEIPTIDIARKLNIISTGKSLFFDPGFFYTQGVL